MKTGDKACADPAITGLNHWIEGVIIKVRKNPFLGIEIAIKDSSGNIYFDAEKYFKPISS
ncbi:MAG: hypothetical protein EAZ53_14325 [Bacteroidetes bacterium]|nr:MAG: hypothetical protein EAZ53_14325 [Bacteroidota bacterium]